MDKLKTQASSLAEAGQSKLTGMQAKKQADAMLLELGGLVYEQRVGRTAGGPRVDELVAQIQSFEAGHGLIAVTPVTPPAGSTGSYLPGGGGAPPGTVDGGASGTAIPGAQLPGTPVDTGVYQTGGIPQAVGGIPQSGGIPQPVGGVPQATTGDPVAAGDAVSDPPPDAADATPSAPTSTGGLPSGSYLSDTPPT